MQLQTIKNIYIILNLNKVDLYLDYINVKTILIFIKNINFIWHYLGNKIKKLIGHKLNSFFIIKMSISIIIFLKKKVLLYKLINFVK